MCRLHTNEILENYGGPATNCLETIFSNVDNDETSPAIFCQKSSYLDPNDKAIESFLKENSGNFTVLSLNADSLHKKHIQLSIFVELLLNKGLFFSAIAIQECRITDKTNCNPLDIPQYKLEPMGQVCSKKGGLVIYLHDNFNGVAREDLYKKSSLWEAQFLTVTGESIDGSITLINLYRPPRRNNNLETIKQFIKEFKPCLTKLQNENNFKILCADFNINLLKVNEDQGVNDFFDFICLKDFLPQITLPTRFDTASCSLIDNILVCPPTKQGILDGSSIKSHVYLVLSQSMSI